MPRFLTVLIVGSLLLTGAGCSNAANTRSTAPTGAQNTMPNALTLQESLEQVYEPTRMLTTQATPDAYFAAIEPSVLSEQTKTEMRQGWKFAAALMKDMMPPLNSPNLKLYKVTQAGDWAGYYYAYKTDDGITSFAVRRFHQINGVWKVADFSMVEIEASEYETMPENNFEQLIQEKTILRVTPPSRS